MVVQTAIMKFIAALLAVVPFVAAHGFVQNATIGGKEYDVLTDSPVSKLGMANRCDSSTT
jgi:hypothetical protein